MVGCVVIDVMDYEFTINFVEGLLVSFVDLLWVFG